MAAPQKSFRRLLNPFLEMRPWTHMGIDFLMGLPADKISEGTEASFLPDYLHLLVKNAKVAEISGSNRELSLPDKIHYQEVQRDPKSSLKPEWILWPLVLACMISLIFDTYFTTFFKWINKILLFGFGTFGLLLLILWIATSHYIFNFNTDILWANPLLFVVLFLKPDIGRMPRSRIKFIFLLIVFFVVAAGSLTSIILEKNLNLTALSFLLLTALYGKLKSIQKVPEK